MRSSVSLLVAGVVFSLIALVSPAFADTRAVIKSASEFDLPPFCIFSNDGKAYGFTIILILIVLVLVLVVLLHLQVMRKTKSLVQEIDERKKAEAALRSRERRFAQLLENSFDNIVVLDADGIQRYVSQSVFRSLGYQPDELLNIPVMERMIHPDDQKKVKESFLQIINDRQQGAIEYRHRHKNGGWVDLEAWGTNQLSNPDIQGVVINCRVVTERKRAQQLMRLSIENMMDAYALHEAIFDGRGVMTDYRFLEFNAAAQKISGVSRKDIIGKTALALYPHIVERGLMKKYAEVMRTGVSARIEDFYYEGDGLSKAFDISCFRIDEKHFVCIFRDITERKRTEDALRKIQQLFAEAEKIGRVGGWELKIDTGKQTWTEEVYRIHEVEATFDPTVDKGVDFYAPASRLIIKEAVKRAIEHGEPFDLELEIITAKGNLRNVHAVGKADLENRRIFGFFQDITERKRVEEELKAVNEKFSLLANNIDGYLAFVNADTLQYEFVSGEFERSFGLPREKIIGQHVQKVIGEGNYRFALRFIDEVRAGKPVSYENSFDMVSGKRWIQVKYSPVFDANGRVASIAVLCYDITERKRVEELLRISEMRYRELLVNLEAAVVVHAPDTAIITNNDRALELLGLSEEQIKGRKALDPEWKFVHEDMTPFLLNEYPVNKIISEKRAVKDLCLGIKRPNRNDIVWVSVNGVPIFDMQGAISEVIISFIDITERKKAELFLKKAKEDAELASQAKSEFLNNIAHDFRTPMQAIMGFSSFFQSENLTAKQKKYADIISEKSKGLLQLVEELLDVSRLDAGRLELRSIEFDLKESVQKAVDMARGDLLDKDVTVGCSMEEGIPPLKGDEVRFNQVLTNLLSNAVKYTDQGDILVKVVREQGDCPEGKCRLRLSVKDTGLGIPKDKQQLIFEAYMRFQEFNGKQERGGVGLGLYITKTLVELMGGTISVVSEVGVGSEFVVMLELDKA